MNRPVYCCMCRNDCLNIQKSSQIWLPFQSTLIVILPSFGCRRCWSEWPCVLCDFQCCHTVHRSASDLPHSTDSGGYGVGYMLLEGLDLVQWSLVGRPQCVPVPHSAEGCPHLRDSDTQDTGAAPEDPCPKNAHSHGSTSGHTAAWVAQRRPPDTQGSVVAPLAIPGCCVWPSDTEIGP